MCVFHLVVLNINVELMFEIWLHLSFFFFFFLKKEKTTKKHVHVMKEAA